MKQIISELIDKDHETFERLVKATGMTPERFLEQFIADITSSAASAGSNERQAAANYFLHFIR